MNILLDPILIFGLGPIPGMGVAGAALATVISQAFSSVMAVRHMWKKTGLISRDIRDYKIDPELSLTTLKVGLPVGVQMTVVSFGQLVISSIINAFGPAVVAGFGAGARIDQFATMPSMSLGMSVSSIVGQNLGAGKQHRVHETVKRALVVSISIGATMTMVAMLFAPVILRIFTVSPEVLVQGSTYLRTVSLGYVPMAIMFTVNGVMRGAGDTFPTMVISVSTLWLIRVPLARYLSALPALGSNGIWWAVVASSAAGTMLSCAYYLSGRWKKRSVLRKHVAPEVADQPASGE